MKIGDRVRVIGPSISGQTGDIGHEFTIYQENKGIFFTNGQEYNYPESSLQLVEELKMGDWVKVIGPAGNGNDFSRGYIFQISEKSPIGEFSTKKAAWYPLTSLRKLAPSHAELLSDVGALAERAGAIEKQLADQQDETSDIEEDLYKIFKRLSAIEEHHVFIAKQVEDLQRAHVCQGDQLTDHLNDDMEMSEIKRRLAILEGEMPEVVDRKRIDIPVGACFSVEKKPNEGVSVTYSDGGFELAKAVLDSMKEA